MIDPDDVILPLLAPFYIWLARGVGGLIEAMAGSLWGMAFKGKR